jgi:hypothetical protein
MSGGQLCLPGFAATDKLALLEKSGACGAVDRAINPATAEERLIRSVDDRVNLELGDVATNDGRQIRGWLRGLSAQRSHSAAISKGARGAERLPVDCPLQCAVGQ